MVRSARKSLTEAAVAAARKVVSRAVGGVTHPEETKAAGRRTPATTPSAAGSADTPAAAEVKKSTTKGAAPKKSAAAKTPAKKSTAKKATSGQSAAKKAASKKAASSKAASSKAVSKQAVSKKATSKKAPSRTAKPTSAKADKSGQTPTSTSPTSARRTKTPPAPTPGKERRVKKTATKLPVRDGESPWTKAEIDEVIKDLKEHRGRLVDLIADQEVELRDLMRDAGDGAGHDHADVGATTFERDHELTVVNSEREMLAAIDHALARITDGTFGRCEECDEPIGKMRVMAFPRATLCLSCKQREERR